MSVWARTHVNMHVSPEHVANLYCMFLSYANLSTAGLATSFLSSQGLCFLFHPSFCFCSSNLFFYIFSTFYVFGL